MVILALMLAAASPSPEALSLGRQLAETDTLAGVLPLISAKETEELIAAHPELSAADRTALRATAQRVFEAGRDRLMAATGRAYAERLSLRDLRRLVAFQKSGAARRYRAATPMAIAATMQSVGKLDFKGDVIAAFCKERGRLCAAK
jgi:hypothetical protein